MTDNAVQEIVDEARGEFDLLEELEGRKKRTDSITVYTDEETGAELGGYEIVEYRDDLGLKKQRLRKWGVKAELLDLTGELDEITKAKTRTKNAARVKEIEARIAELEARAVELSAELEKSGLKITLRALERVEKKVANRAARKELGIRGKISADQEEDFYAEHNAQLLHLAVVSIEKLATGQVNTGISIEGARALDGKLPDGEYAKVVAKLSELNFQNAIARQAVTDADF